LIDEERELVGLATAFADEAGRSGLEGALQQRAKQFKEITSSGSPLDNAAQALHAALEGSKLYLPDFDAPGRRTRFARSVRLNKLWTIADYLADLEKVRWNLPKALEDADDMDRLDAEPAMKQAFKAWRQALGAVVVQVDREHLFGCHLLLECQAAQASLASSSDNHEDLRRRLAPGLCRFLRAMQDAVEHLVLSGEQPCPPSPFPTAPK
jgi:hypothetical protein